MQVISHGPPMVVELTPQEINLSRAFEEFLDMGWDIYTALRYAERRYGPATPPFRKWIEGV